MRIRFLAGLTAVTCAAGAWLTAPVLAQQSGEQSNEVEQALVQYVQDVMGGANVPPDVTLTWDTYFVKAEAGQVYVPFTVALPENALENDVNMYYSVIPKGPRMSMFTATPEDGSEGMIEIAGEVTNTASAPAQNVVITITMLDAQGLSLGTQEATVATVASGQTAAFTVSVKESEGTEQYSVVVDGSSPVFWDLSTQELPNAGSDGVVRLRRAFMAPAGEYDFILVLREREARDSVATPRRLALLREDVTVPDYGSDLAVSSIFLARSINVLSSSLDPDDQLDQPFTLGTMVNEPLVEVEAGTPSIRQSAELSIIFFAYNAGSDDNKKPDVEIQYNFHIKTNEGEQFFNRTSPQQLNAETLPAEFDLTAGHQIVGVQSIPMASFEPGKYRMEIKVNDTLSGQSVTQNVPFMVVGS